MNLLPIWTISSKYVKNVDETINTALRVSEKCKLIKPHNRTLQSDDLQKNGFGLDYLVPIVASGEYSFSKLRLIENFIKRSFMSQGRLLDLAVILIGKEISEELDLSHITDTEGINGFQRPLAGYEREFFNRKE
nr:unnamed protein product [Callosobruchus chinensis]